MAQLIKDLLDSHTNLKKAVMVLQKGCQGSNAGNKAMDEWDDILLAEAGKEAEWKKAAVAKKAAEARAPGENGYLVLMLDGSPLWLTGVKRGADGIISSGYVENGHWDLVLKAGGEYHAMGSNGFSSHSRNSWIPKEYTEIRVTKEMLEPLGGVPDYNSICEAAKLAYIKHRERNP